VERETPDRRRPGIEVKSHLRPGVPHELDSIAFHSDVVDLPSPTTFKF
jgi:hypothetical protein